eukprot:6016130-Prymnesium_polylepis.1
MRGAWRHRPARAVVRGRQAMGTATRRARAAVRGRQAMGTATRRARAAVRGAGSPSEHREMRARVCSGGRGCAAAGE